MAASAVKSQGLPALWNRFTGPFSSTAHRKISADAIPTDPVPVPWLQRAFLRAQFGNFGSGKLGFSVDAFTELNRLVSPRIQMGRGSSINLQVIQFDFRNIPVSTIAFLRP